MRACEWDPVKSRPVLQYEIPHAEATLVLGGVGTGTWHLCESCARLPMFAFLKQKPLGSARKGESR
jgi:hypothetical protein